MTSIPLLVVVGVRHDGEKVLLAVKNMDGETEAAWQHVLDDLLARGLVIGERWRLSRPRTASLPMGGNRLHGSDLQVRGLPAAKLP